MAQTSGSADENFGEVQVEKSVLRAVNDGSA